MGYTTGFEGQFKLDKPLTDVHREYLIKFSETRRMDRNSSIAEKFPDPTRNAAKLPIGEHGEHFVNGTGFAGQDDDESVIHHNSPPPSQPGLWCRWTPTPSGECIEWDGSEKFSNYIEWLEYIIKHFLEPWGYVLNGEVTWEGAEQGDVGKIIVKNNRIKTKKGRIVYD